MPNIIFITKKFILKLVVKILSVFQFDMDCMCKYQGIYVINYSGNVEKRQMSELLLNILKTLIQILFMLEQKSATFCEFPTWCRDRAGAPNITASLMRLTKPGCK